MDHMDSMDSSGHMKTMDSTDMDDMGGLGFYALVVFALSLAFILFFTIPFSGVLVRFRANYSPKGLQLDAEGGAQAHAGPVVSSYFGMMARVYRLEGFSGFFKGLMPTLLSLLLVSFVIMFTTSTAPVHGAYRAPRISILGMFFYAFGLMILNLPTTVLTARAITTPHRLAYFQPRKALRLLLTPTERRRPWILYLTPGLMAAQVSHIAYIVFVLGMVRRLLMPADLTNIPRDEFPTYKFTFLIVFTMLSTVVLTPLEVISVRLAIQRNHASGGFNSVAQEEEGDAEETVEFAGAGEDVIGLRSEADPYVGMIDCAKRIMDEEGARALFRGWWVTMLLGGTSL